MKLIQAIWELYRYLIISIDYDIFEYVVLSTMCDNYQGGFLLDMKYMVRYLALQAGSPTLSRLRYT